MMMMVMMMDEMDDGDGDDDEKLMVMMVRVMVRGDDDGRYVDVDGGARAADAWVRGSPKHVLGCGVP